MLYIIVIYFFLTHFFSISLIFFSLYVVYISPLLPINVDYVNSLMLNVLKEIHMHLISFYLITPYDVHASCYSINYLCAHLVVLFIL